MHRNCTQELKLDRDFCATCSVALFIARNLMILHFQWFVDGFLARLDAGWKAADDHVERSVIEESAGISVLL